MSDFANKIRPESLKDIVGQKHLKPLLNKMIEKNNMTSLILYGKPGIGKTSIAYALSNDLKLSHSYFNAATGNKKELEAHLDMSDIIIIDEIHRLNKDKQDILLPRLERGRAKIIATTTENPFFTVVPALRSRTHILELKSLTHEDITDGLKNIIKSQKFNIKISDDMIQKIATSSNGDFRFAANSLNLIQKLYPNKKIDKSILEIVIPTINFYSDKNGDGHYNLLSAFHKSLRGSDVDAALYYLTQLIETGDILGMERRLIMVVYEDVGLANPNLTLRLQAAMENVKKVGFPEASIILSYLVIDICKSQKSNSAYKALSKAQNIIKEKGVFEMPKHIKCGHYKSASKLGNGVGYKYPHDYGGYVEQQYLPEEISSEVIYEKNDNDKI